MSRYLTPDDLQTIFGIKKTTAYEVFKEYREQGGEVIKLGKQHAEEEPLIQFLRSRNAKHS